MSDGSRKNATVSLRSHESPHQEWFGLCKIQSVVFSQLLLENQPTQ